MWVTLSKIRLEKKSISEYRKYFFRSKLEVVLICVSDVLIPSCVFELYLEVRNKSTDQCSLSRKKETSNRTGTVNRTSKKKDSIKPFDLFIKCCFTEAASCEIVKFLEIESTEETSNGWMLLSTINLLSTGASSLIDCMTAASLPSTLVKCLYLLFDLPDVKNAHQLEPGCEFSPMERRILLQKVFVQVLPISTKPFTTSYEK